MYGLVAYQLTPLVDHAYAGLADAFIGMVDTSTMPLKHEITKKKPAAAAGVDLDGPLGLTCSRTCCSLFRIISSDILVRW